MTNQQKQVLHFMRVFEQHIEVHPNVPDYLCCALRRELIQEEFRELMDAMKGEDINAIAKEAADLLYVILGMANAFGFDLEPVFDEVHRSNMSKVGGKISASGKLMKPSTYSPANVAPLLKPWEG